MNTIHKSCDPSSVKGAEFFLSICEFFGHKGLKKINNLIDEEKNGHEAENYHSDDHTRSSCGENETSGQYYK